MRPILRSSSLAIFVIAAATIAVLTVGHIAAQEKKPKSVQLAIRPTANTAIRLKTTSTTEIFAPVGSATFKLVEHWVLTPKRKQKNGNWLCDIFLEDVSGSAKNLQGKVVFDKENPLPDSDTIVTPEIRAIVARRGKRVQVTISPRGEFVRTADLGKKLQNHDVSEAELLQMELQPMIPIFPKKATKVGVTWNYGFRINFGGMRGAVSVAAKVAQTEDPKKAAKLSRTTVIEGIGELRKEQRDPASIKTIQGKLFASAKIKKSKLVTRYEISRLDGFPLTGSAEGSVDLRLQNPFDPKTPIPARGRFVAKLERWSPQKKPSK